MFKRISQFLGSLSGEKLPVDREEQNAWVKARFHEWQLDWHEFFDADEELLKTGEFDRPDPLPSDIDRDYRLIFGISRAAPATRARCFGCFPAGGEMNRRFEAYLSGKPDQMLEPEARERFRRVGELITGLEPNEKVDFSRIHVVDRETAEGHEMVENADDITILLERSLLEPEPPSQLRQLAARLFLTEPLYATGNNSYHFRDWVTAAMSGGATDAVHNQLYEMWCGGWQVFLGPNGVILAKHKV